MQRTPILTVFLALVFATAGMASARQASLDLPPVVLNNVGFRANLTIEGDSLAPSAYAVRAGGTTFEVQTDDDGSFAQVESGGSGRMKVELLRQGRVVTSSETRSIPGWWSILPPIIAIGMALSFKQVVPALFIGIWSGAVIAIGFTFFGLGAGLMDTLQVYVLQSLADPSHAAIILFSFMIGGMVGIMSKNGGMQGVVNRIITWAKNPRKGQTATGALGVAIFFDDYANSLVVGNTMRPVTDRLRISREKLSYIVDSTAAPVACLALVTTWIGYEVGLIGTAVRGIDGLDASAYSLFLASIPYSFYPILAVFFVFAVAVTGLDFGPMYKAELRARTTGQLVRPDADVDEAAVSGEEMAPKAGKPHRVINAALPVLVLVVAVLVGLYVTGEGNNLREIIGSADSYKALMWGSLLGVLTAAGLSVTQRILTMSEVVDAWYNGLKGMMFAMIILVLAWSLSHITDVLHTADYLVSVLGEALHPGVVPAMVFILAAATAFATGSSWGTMGILYPLVVPLAWAVLVLNGEGDAGHYPILYSTISCVLAGSVWGDHCSPISDTTILSSLASGSDHIDHVRTQLPYALLVGGVSILIGTLPTGFGIPWWVSMPAGAIALVVFLRVVGKSSDAAQVIS